MRPRPLALIAYTRACWRGSLHACGACDRAAGACRCADFLLLNKMDCVSEKQLASLSAVVSSLNPLAKVSAACSPFES